MKNFKVGRYDYGSYVNMACYAICSLLVPTSLYCIAKDLDFPLEEGGKGLGGMLQMGRSAPMVFAMIFCTLAAGKLGKAKTLGYSMVLMGQGIVLCSAAPSYVWMIPALMISGLAEGMIEGLATPFVQELHPVESGRYISFAHSFWSIGVLAVTLAAGWLLAVGVGWRAIMAVTGAATILLSALLLFPDRKKRLPDPVPVNGREIASQIWEVCRVPRFWLFFAAMFFAGGAEWCLTYWVSSFIKLEYAGATMFQAGIGAACFAGGMIAGRIVPSFFVRQEQLCGWVILTGLGAAVVSLFFPHITSLWVLYVLLVLIGFATGPFWPDIQSYCTDRVAGDYTTIFVFLSCSGIPGCGIFSYLMGVCGDAFGLRYSFYLATLCYLIMTGLMTFDWSNRKRHPGKAFPVS